VYHHGLECYTRVVPTTRPRHLVTETEVLSEALDAAAVRWPGVSRSQLLVRLALAGHRASQQARDERRLRRLAALHKHSGALTGAYGPDYLQRLREDWPG
jgi:hypothetical protein